MNSPKLVSRCEKTDCEGLTEEETTSKIVLFKDQIKKDSPEITLFRIEPKIP